MTTRNNQLVAIMPAKKAKTAASSTSRRSSSSSASAAQVVATATQSDDNLLPWGTTAYYVEFLSKRLPETEDDSFYADLRLNYPHLRFLPPSTYGNPSQQPTKKDLLLALMKACGTRTMFGYLTSSSIVALDTLLLMLLDDPNLLKDLCTYPDTTLQVMNLDLHLSTPESRRTALELVTLLSLSLNLSNYMNYIKKRENRTEITRLLQLSSQEIKIAKNANNKRPRPAEPTLEYYEESDEESASAASRRSYSWMWEDTDCWKAYDDSANERIETAFKSGFRVYKVTNQWFVDFIHMEQRRSDDPGKKRRIRRDELERKERDIVLDDEDEE